MENEVEKIVKQFGVFFYGVRLLMLIRRSKEGGISNKPDRGAKKFVTDGIDDFKEKLGKLLEMKTEGERIYSSVNPRNMGKAMRKFKELQLDADYADRESQWKFYFDIKNRWVSSLMKPTSRESTHFLLDIDKGDDDEEAIEKQLKKNKILTVLAYQTKNGRHIITEPFNPALMPAVEIKKDALLLLSF